MNRKTKITILSILAALVAIGCYARIEYVNSQYPIRDEIEFAEDEEASFAGWDPCMSKFEYGDISVLVQRAAIMSENELSVVLPDYVDGVIEAGGASEMKAIFITTQLTNDTGKTQKIALYRFTVQSGAWSNVIDPNVFSEINEVDALEVELEAGESEAYTFPYFVYDTHFATHSQWKNLKERDFDFVLSTYPTKYEIRLDLE